MNTPLAICFVCHGNICRSPTAEAVMRKFVEDAGLAHAFEIDSAGVSAEHEGELADARSREAAARRGYAMEGRARPLVLDDFSRFDLLLAADRENVRRIERLAAGLTGPRRARVQLLREYDSERRDRLEIPDPWSSGPVAFVQVLEICERSCRALLESLRPDRGQSPRG